MYHSTVKYSLHLSIMHSPRQNHRYVGETLPGTLTKTLWSSWDLSNDHNIIYLLTKIKQLWCIKKAKIPWPHVIFFCCHFTVTLPWHLGDLERSGELITCHGVANRKYQRTTQSLPCLLTFRGYFLLISSIRWILFLKLTAASLTQTTVWKTNRPKVCQSTDSSPTKHQPLEVSC